MIRVRIRDALILFDYDYQSGLASDEVSIGGGKKCVRGLKLELQFSFD